MSEIDHSVIEHLSVELWREIFDYFDPIELWYSFYGLNKKINEIIHQTILYINIDNQDKYDYFMKYIISSINTSNIHSLKIKKIISLKDFFSIYSINSLIQLRLLSLTLTYPFDNNSLKFWNQLLSLKYLQSLKIIIWINSNFENCIEEKEYIIRSIFNKNSCPMLKNFFIETYSWQRLRSINLLPIPIIRTTNIEYLSIDSLSLNNFIKLIPALQNLKSFRIISELIYDNELNEQQQILIPQKFLSKCIQLHLKLSKDIIFQHIEYLLKLTPNLKNLFIWGWYHLLNAETWQVLLSTQCPQLLKFELISTGLEYDENFHQTSYNFQEDCANIPFWIERNVTITNNEDHSSHDYCSDTVARFNIKTSEQSIGKD